MNIVQIRQRFVDDESAEINPEVKVIPVGSAKEAREYLMKRVSRLLKEVGSGDIKPRYSRWPLSLDTDRLAEDGIEAQYLVRHMGTTSSVNPAASVYVPGCEVDIKWYLVK